MPASGRAGSPPGQPRRLRLARDEAAAGARALRAMARRAEDAGAAATLRQPRAVAARLRKTNPLLPADRAAWLARTGRARATTPRRARTPRRPGAQAREPVLTAKTSARVLEADRSAGALGRRRPDRPDRLVGRPLRAASSTRASASSPTSSTVRRTPATCCITTSRRHSPGCSKRSCQIAGLPRSASALTAILHGRRTHQCHWQPPGRPDEAHGRPPGVSLTTTAKL